MLADSLLYLLAGLFVEIVARLIINFPKRVDTTAEDTMAELVKLQSIQNEDNNKIKFRTVPSSSPTP